MASHGLAGLAGVPLGGWFLVVGPGSSGSQWCPANLHGPLPMSPGWGLEDQVAWDPQCGVGRSMGLVLLVLDLVTVVKGLV